MRQDGLVSFAVNSFRAQPRNSEKTTLKYIRVHDIASYYITIIHLYMLEDGLTHSPSTRAEQSRRTVRGPRYID